MNKYNAKGIWFDVSRQKIINSPSLKARRDNRCLYHLDSLFEFQVYERLVAVFGIGRVQIHPMIPVIYDPTKVYPNGLNWKADFAVLDAHKVQRHIIEAKGLIHESFRLKMSLLEQHNPRAFERVLMVFRTMPHKADLEWLPESVKFSCIENYFKSLPTYRAS
ncbi:MAG: hypothetical protein ACRC11_08120 [Xenococcaceae cyanobacterium]